MTPFFRSLLQKIGKIGYCSSENLCYNMQHSGRLTQRLLEKSNIAMKG